MIRPLRDQVLLRRDEAADMTPSGLLALPETARDFRNTFATILRTGPKVSTVKPGDRVLLHVYGGVEFREEGVLLALIPEDDIFAVLPDASA